MLDMFPERILYEFKFKLFNSLIHISVLRSVYNKGLCAPLGAFLKLAWINYNPII